MEGEVTQELSMSTTWSAECILKFQNESETSF